MPLIDSKLPADLCAGQVEKKTTLKRAYIYTAVTMYLEVSPRIKVRLHVTFGLRQTSRMGSVATSDRGYT